MAVTIIVLVTMALSLGDALIKKASADLVLWQIFVMRSLVALPVLVAAMRLRTGTVLSGPIGFWTTLRSLMLTFMWVAYYVALPHLELSVAAAAYYTLPIFITLLSALFVGESIGRFGWLAVVAGFAGVLLILRPAAGDFNAYALLPLLAALLYAGAMILTRTKCRDVDPLELSLVLNLTFVAVGLIATFIVSNLGLTGRQIYQSRFLLGDWAPLGVTEWLTIAMLAASILIGSIGAAIAYQNAPSPIVATFDFSYIAFAVIWGMMFFDEFPDGMAWLGMALIVGAGILAVTRGARSLPDAPSTSSREG